MSPSHLILETPLAKLKLMMNLRSRCYMQCFLMLNLMQPLSRDALEKTESWIEISTPRWVFKTLLISYEILISAQLESFKQSWPKLNST